MQNIEIRAWSTGSGSLVEYHTSVWVDGQLAFRGAHAPTPAQAIAKALESIKALGYWK